MKTLFLLFSFTMLLPFAALSAPAERPAPSTGVSVGQSTPAPAVPASAASAASVDQRKGLGVTVHDSVRQALAYSPQLQQAQEARQQAAHEVRRAESGYFPTIGIWGGAGVTQSDDSGTRATNEDNKTVGTGTAGMNFSQSVWQGGATSSLVRSREATLEAQTHMVTDNATLLVFNAVASHVDVIRRRFLLQLSEQNVKQHKEILSLLHTRFEQGIASQGEVAQVQSRLSRAEATQLTHKMGLSAALANYNRITGQPALRLLQPVPLPRVVYDRLDKVRDDSVQHNARLLAELANVRSAVGERDYARSGFSPRLSIDGGPSYADWGRKGTNYQWTWSAMLNMRWDIYSGGADQAAFKSASAKVREMRKSLHSFMDLLDEEIRTTYSRAYDMREQSRHYAKSKVASREARINFFEQFQAGTRGLLDVLDAASEFFYSAVEECISDTDSVLGFYRLLALSGRLLPEMDVPVAALHKNTDAGDSAAKAWNFMPSELDSAATLKGTTLRDSRTGQ